MLQVVKRKKVVKYQITTNIDDYISDSNDIGMLIFGYNTNQEGAYFW
ncbi:10284_t:CDS:2 [Scutellospora calospora]|uniref:10284_t:CDS:1 n=1 Tax=Scutellospora calospora TaxID=85575 RepID=A0ACA9JUM5_9GLOM|nr:10284_t:CDS:2 [Scutellospora calospora]